MDAGTEFSMKLTDGKTLTYRIIGINHDDPAGGSGKAGLKIWNLMPSDFQSRVKAVKKLSNNVGGGDENKNAAVTAT